MHSTPRWNRFARIAGVAAVLTGTVCLIVTKGSNGYVWVIVGIILVSG